MAPQGWLPFGKSWLKVKNADDFQVGDRLVGDVEVKVLAVQCPYISISAAVSRKTAASLVKEWVEADPEVWAPHFLAKWETYWKRDAVGELPAGSMAYLEKVAQVEEVSVAPLDYSLWLQVLQHSKANSMKGVDGWGFAELRLIPKAFVDILLLLFQWCEKVKAWPKVSVSGWSYSSGKFQLVSCPGHLLDLSRSLPRFIVFGPRCGRASC